MKSTRMRKMKLSMKVELKENKDVMSVEIQLKTTMSMMINKKEKSLKNSKWKENRKWKKEKSITKMREKRKTKMREKAMQKDKKSNQTQMWTSA